MPKVIVEYGDTDIPKFHDLKKKFTESAVYSDDGKSVTIGHFRAFRRSAWSLRKYVGFDCYDLDKEKAGLPSYFFMHARRRELDEAVDLLSSKLASLGLTDEDRNQNVARALRAEADKYAPAVK